MATKQKRYSDSHNGHKHPNNGENSDQRRKQLEAILRNLNQVERKLQSVVQEHRHGTFGFVTREWGFTAPGGLGGKLGGKFRPWEEKLEKVNTFFWPIEVYRAMEERPFGLPDPNAVKDLPPEAEQLYGNTPLHEFLKVPPKTKVTLEASDYGDYRSAARIFLLLGTLSHLYGNSAQDRKTAELPAWIEDPLLEVADRLEIEPTLSGHFLVQENWVWKSDAVDAAAAEGGDDDDGDHYLTTETKEGGRESRKPMNETVRTSRRRMSKATSRRVDRDIAQLLLRELECQDRRYRIKIYTNCFLGSQVVDILLDHGYADTREEAVRLGRHVNSNFKLFQHVTNDHMLMDKHFFYRFRKKWQSKIDKNKEEKEDSVVEFDEDVRDFDAQMAEEQGDGDEGEKPRSDENRLMRPSDILRSSILSSSSHHRRSNASENSGVIDHSGGVTNMPRPSQLLRNTTINLYEPASLPETMSIIAIMGTVKVKDRRFRLRVYKKCFVGSQLIDVMMEHECASSRKEAVNIAVAINKKFRLFEHVVDNHQIKDEYLFFRFTQVFQNMIETQDFFPSSSIRMEQSMTFLRASDAKSGISGTTTSSVGRMFDENLKNSSDEVRSSGSSMHSFDTMFGLDETDEFRLDNITMLYPAFGNNHERVNQLVPACMGNAFAGLPFYVLDIITAMKNILEAELNVDDNASIDDYESRRLLDLLYKVAFSASRCKEQFQQMSTDPASRSFNSKYVSIKQTQPLSNGVLVRRKKGGEPKLAKGTTGTQFPYFHLLDWLMGRFQYGDGDNGLVARIASVDETFPRPQREFIQGLSKLEKTSTLRGFMEALGRPKELLAAYNHLVECYSGEGGVLQAHCRKLYSYIHNNVQSSTSGTNHLASSSGGAAGGCPVRPISNAADNHNFAAMMFKHMRNAAEDRWKLRLPPLMTEVGKMVYSTSESGGFTTVALDLEASGLHYEYGDVVKVLVPNCEKTALSWMHSLSTNKKEHFKLEDMAGLYKDTGNGWGWNELWEALDWGRFEKNGGKGVPLEIMSRYIEQGQIRGDSGKARWVNCTLDLGGGGSNKFFATPSPVALDKVASLEPVSPRVYSVSGVEASRVFLLISKPQDGACHHGYEGMSNAQIERVHCSFSPATFFLVPPQEVNLVCIASGTGISPFVGLVDSIGSREGSYTIVHQCKSSDLFLANSQTWLDFTCINPGSVVIGYISGDKSRRNCPMRYVIRNGEFEETTVLRRRNISAYYFECKVFQNIIEETYKRGGLNLAYCCGGVKSAIEPLKNFAEKKGLEFEFTSETYGVPSTVSMDSTASQIGGTIVNLDHVSPIHPGGDQIIHQLNDVVAEETADDPVKSSTPDHSIAFYELHPHAYNLHRCLRTPLDADSEAFASFLAREAMSKSVMTSMATKYAEVALSSPEDSKIVKIATELQSSAIRQQISSGDTQGAKKSAEFLEQLLTYVPQEDNAAERWMQSLTDFHGSFANEAHFQT